jgi:hypothetical protein
MKSFFFRQGMNAEGPVGEADEFVIGVRHGALNLNLNLTPNPKAGGI